MNLHGTRDADVSRAPLITQVSVWIAACVHCRRHSSRTCNLIVQKSLVKQKMNEKKKRTYLGLETHMHLVPPFIVSDGGPTVPVPYT